MKKDYNRIEAIVDIGDNEFELVNCNMEPVKAIENDITFWFEYDNFGRRISMVDSDGLKVIYEYDKHGNIAKKFFYKNYNTLTYYQQFDNGYDIEGRLIYKHCDGFDVIYEYDDNETIAKKFFYKNYNTFTSYHQFNNEYDTKRRLIYKHCGSDSVRYTYNEFGDIIQEIHDASSDYIIKINYKYNYDTNVLYVERFINDKFKYRKIFNLFKYRYGLHELTDIKHMN